MRSPRRSARRGLTVPTELQAKLDADGRPLLEPFTTSRRGRISIQHWSWRRVGLLAGTWAAARRRHPLHRQPAQE